MPLTNPQKTVSDSKARFKVLVMGRRGGKTFLAMNELAKFARFPDRKIMYIAPSIRMSRQIMWEDLKNKLTRLRWIESKNENDLSIKLKNGTMIALRGAENYDSLRGIGLDFVVLDEFADIKKEVWTNIIRPSLADRNGHALFTGTPKGTANWSYDMYTNAKFEHDWDSWTFTTVEGGQVSPEELEMAKRELDPKTFRQEFEASFESYEGLIYYNYNRPRHVEAYNFPQPSILHVGIDFNINPGAAVVMAKHGEGLWAIDELILWNSNTHEMAQELKNKFPKSRMIMYPDPAGRALKTSAMGRSDHQILENEGLIVKTRRHSIPVRDRINAVNSLLLNEADQVRFKIDPKCKWTIKALERMSYREGTMIPDLRNDYNHVADAFGYAIEYNYPVARNKVKQAEPVRWAVPIRA